MERELWHQLYVIVVRLDNLWTNGWYRVGEIVLVFRPRNAKIRLNDARKMTVAIAFPDTRYMVYAKRANVGKSGMGLKSDNRARMCIELAFYRQLIDVNNQQLPNDISSYEIFLAGEYTKTLNISSVIQHRRILTKTEDRANSWP